MLVYREDLRDRLIRRRAAATCSAPPWRWTTRPGACRATSWRRWR
ncbi:hypothetical protein [Teichococcus aestuarii]